MPLNISRSTSSHGIPVENSDDGEALYSFENICETLGLHPDPIRKGLLVWKEAKLKLGYIDAERAGRSKLARSRVKHPSVRLCKTA
jgi:hypothetical protein